MTITYANGRTVDALLLSSQGDVVRAAIAGHDDVRIFKQVDGVWRAEDGQPVRLTYAWQMDTRAPVPEESHFICSKELGRQLISSLMNGSETNEGSPAPLYVFSGEKRRLHITVLRGQQRLAG
jgi:hypothetical protein